MEKLDIAIVGSGISGLASAYWLGEFYNVTVFERHGRLGGHVDTHLLNVEGQRLAVDSGFIVFNRKTYPLFSNLLAELGVATQTTDMSFGVIDDVEGWEFCGRDGLKGILSRPSNLLRPRFLFLMREILRFGRIGKHALDSGELSDDLAMKEFLRQKKFGSLLAEAYLIPFGSSIWSADPAQFLDYPAASLLKFFDNHGLLTFRSRPQWETIVGGSYQYVEALVKSQRFSSRVNCEVKRISRNSDTVTVHHAGGSDDFHHVIIATPAPVAIKLLSDAEDDERSVLQKFSTKSNTVTLHGDEVVMPRSRKAWGAWNYHRRSNRSALATVSYWMNLLQCLNHSAQVFVTLNEPNLPAAERIFKTREYEHPVFNVPALQSQRDWHRINGIRRTWFAGAYWYNGFHEDGAQSARRVVDALMQSS